MDAEFVDYEERDGAAVVTIDRPDKLNAMNRRALDELEAALGLAEDADDLRAVVLRGHEEAFSAGYDVGADDGEDETDRTVADWLDRMADYDVITRVYHHDLPVVAAVDGYALAGGCNLALVADLTIATERAEFGYSDLRMGGLPAHFVHPYVVGSLKHARELFYTGKTVSGTEAARMGLVNRAVPHADLMDEVWSEVDAIKKTPGVLVSLAKGMLNDAMEARGYRPDGRQSEFNAALSVATEASREFYHIRDEEGMAAAIDWMHGADKD